MVSVIHFVLIVLNLFSCIVTYDFIFFSPAASFIDQHIAIALELFQREHSLLILTDDRFHERFLRHLNSGDLSSLNHRFQIVSVGKSSDYKELGRLAVQRNHIVTKRAMVMYNDSFKRLVNILETNQTDQNILKAQQTVFSKDSFIVISAPFESPTNFCQRHHLPYAFLLPTPTFLEFWQWPIYDEKTSEKDQGMVFRFRFLLRALRFAFFPAGSHLIDPAHLHRKPVLRLVQSIPSAVLPQAYSPLTVFTGPITSKHRMSLSVLSQSIQDMLSSGNPIVYMSLGSYSSLSRQQLAKLTAAFYPGVDDPWQLIWALSAEQHEKLSHEEQRASRVHIEYWIETPAILNHPSLSLFISHCGANGLNEALLAGVPILGLPLFGDQPTNCQGAERVMKIARCFRLDENTDSELRDAAKLLMADAAIHRTSRQTSFFAKKAYNGVATAADWLETAAELKDDISSLATPVDVYGVVHAYCLDLLVLVCAATAFIGFIVGKCFRWSSVAHLKAA